MPALPIIRIVPVRKAIAHGVIRNRSCRRTAARRGCHNARQLIRPIGIIIESLGALQARRVGGYAFRVR